jgi:hypothetical protein
VGIRFENLVNLVLLKKASALAADTIYMLPQTIFNSFPPFLDYRGSVLNASFPGLPCSWEGLVIDAFLMSGHLLGEASKKIFIFQMKRFILRSQSPFVLYFFTYLLSSHLEGQMSSISF